LKLDAAAGPFEVTARADRIDIGQDGAVCIYDFKTSANAAETYARHGAQQLALEGLLVREGAFAGIPPGSEPELRYIIATGGEPPGKVVEPKAPCAEVIQAAATALPLRIACFDDPATPYACERHAIFRDKANHDPYSHLARVKEWSAGGNEEEADDD
ncbi:MAG: PD-(D/E)XK nuclease family protein, partial [Rhodomicrobium sp.]